MYVTPFGRLFAASAVSNLGDGLRLAALPLLAASLTRDPGAVAAMTAVIWLPWLLFGAIGGAIVDRVHRVRLLMLVQLGRMLVVATLAVLVWTGAASMTLLYLAAFLFGIGEMLADTTMQTLVPALVPSDDLERANGRLFASQSVANEFVGPPMGSVLFSTIPAAPFAASAVAWGTSALALSRLEIAQPSREGRPATSLLQEIVEGGRWLFGQPILRALAVWAVFVNASIAAFTSIEVLFALEVLGIPEVAYGFLAAAAGAGGITGTLLAAWAVRRFGRSRVVQAGSSLHGLSALAAGLLPHPLLFATLLFLMTAAAAAVIIVLTALRQTIVPGRMLGRMVATTRVFGYGALPVGALFGGWLATTFDLRTPFVLGGIVILLAGLLIGRWLTPHAIEAARAAAHGGG